MALKELDLLGEGRLVERFVDTGDKVAFESLALEDFTLFDLRPPSCLAVCVLVGYHLPFPLLHLHHPLL